MDTSTIIAIIIGIITVITVVVIIVIQNKRPTPSSPTDECDWKQRGWSTDSNTQMNIQDTNYPQDCQDVKGKCGNWKRTVTCESSNGVGICTDNDCTETKPIETIDCGPCSKPPPTPQKDDIIRVGDDVKLYYYDFNDGTNKPVETAGVRNDYIYYSDGSFELVSLTIFVDGKKPNEPVTQKDKIELRTQTLTNGDYDQFLTIYNSQYLYKAVNVQLNDYYRTKFNIITADAASGTNDVIRENTSYNFIDAVDNRNVVAIENTNYLTGQIMVSQRDNSIFVNPLVLKLEKV